MKSIPSYIWKKSLWLSYIGICNIYKLELHRYIIINFHIVRTGFVVFIYVIADIIQFAFLKRNSAVNQILQSAFSKLENLTLIGKASVFKIAVFFAQSFNRYKIIRLCLYSCFFHSRSCFFFKKSCLFRRLFGNFYFGCRRLCCNWLFSFLLVAFIVACAGCRH